jgi:hypothetical protein
MRDVVDHVFVDLHVIGSNRQRLILGAELMLYFGLQPILLASTMFKVVRSKNTLFYQ